MSVQFSYAVQTLDEAACTSEDVSERLGPVRDQGNIGWCYANVAADLLTFKFHRELNGKQASAGFVALTFNQFSKIKANEDAGYVSPAVWFSQKLGICPQDFQDLALKDSPYKTIKDQIDGLVRLKERYDLERRRDGDWIRLLSVYKNSQSYINRVSTGELSEILDNSTAGNFPRKLAERLCQNYMVRVPFDFSLRPQFDFWEGWKNVLPMVLGQRQLLSPRASGRQDLISEIHNEISNKNMVGISYRTRIFYAPNSEPYKKAGLHASSIVGRRWKNGRCEFKLRNSWGVKSCYAYTNPELKGQCETNTGYLWIPDAILERELRDIMYYRK